MDRPLLEERAADDGTGDRLREARDQLPASARVELTQVYGGRTTMFRDEPEVRPGLFSIHEAEVRTGELYRALHHTLKQGFKVEDRAAHRGEHVGDGGLLFERLL